MIRRCTFLLLLSVCAAGCQSTPERPVHRVLLGPEPDFMKMASFQQLVDAEPSDKNYEDLRVGYLLERIGKSEHGFFRNEELYGKQRAMLHLRWKYFHNRGDFNTAEQYIDQVAWGSFISGKDYLVQISENEYYPLRWVLHNELDLLDDILNRQRAVKLQWEAAQASKKAIVGTGESLKETAFKSDNPSVDQLSALSHEQPL